MLRRIILRIMLRRLRRSNNNNKRTHNAIVRRAAYQLKVLSDQVELAGWRCIVGRWGEDGRVPHGSPGQHDASGARRLSKEFNVFVQANDVLRSSTEIININE